MMLEHVGEDAAGARLQDAIATVVRDGPRTADLGGEASTAEVSDAVLAAIEASSG
jgi:isocitrate/isopropylmalate dehydrogenase